MMAEDMRMSYNESLISRLFRRAKVKVQLIDENVLGETLVHTILISEIIENDEEFLANRLMT